MHSPRKFKISALRLILCLLQLWKGLWRSMMQLGIHPDQGSVILLRFSSLLTETIKIISHRIIIKKGDLTVIMS